MINEPHLLLRWEDDEGMHEEIMSCPGPDKGNNGFAICNECGPDDEEKLKLAEEAGYEEYTVHGVQHTCMDEWRVDTHECLVCDPWVTRDQYLEDEGEGAFLASFKYDTELELEEAHMIIKLDEVVFRALLDAHNERQKLREESVALSWAASGGEDMGR